MWNLLLSKLINVKNISGNTWGLGGTCVNVGCIPKKLFHISTQVKESMHLVEDFGWGKPPSNSKNDWEVLRGNI